MARPRDRSLLLAALWAVMVAVFVVLLLRGASWETLGVVAAAAVLAGTGLLVALDLRARLGIQADLGRGKAKRALTTAEGLLASEGRERSRAPLLIYKAAALSLLGRWAEAIETLDLVHPDRLPRLGADSWRLFHVAVLFDCLVFSRHLGRARSVFESRLEPLARKLGTRPAALTLEECQATLAFLDGELGESRELFTRLLDEEGVPPTARATACFFLGCIAEEEGDRAAADEAWERARGLAPETFLPDRIESIRSGRRR